MPYFYRISSQFILFLFITLTHSFNKYLLSTCYAARCFQALEIYQNETKAHADTLKGGSDSK